MKIIKVLDICSGDFVFFAKDDEAAKRWLIKKNYVNKDSIYLCYFDGSDLSLIERFGPNWEEAILNFHRTDWEILFGYVFLDVEVLE